VPLRLPRGLVDELLEFAQNNATYDVHDRGNGETLHRSIRIPWDKPIASQHVMDARSRARLQMMQGVRDLVVDSTLLDAVQRYLGCSPVNSQTSFWWSHANGPRDNDLTKLFHRDLDFTRSVKILVSLTDATERTGPTEYVPVSPSKEVSVDPRARRTDATAMKKRYGASSIRQFTGPAGSMIAFDPVIFHRGSAPDEGVRAILQVEWVSSTFSPAWDGWPIQTGLSPDGPWRDVLTNETWQRVHERWRVR
jgi:Phytanoyl-CoA dioxygenase (PhyH)